MERGELELVLEVDVEPEFSLSEVLYGEYASLELGSAMEHAKAARGQCHGVCPEIPDQALNDSLVSLQDPKVDRHIASVRLLIEYKVLFGLDIVLENLSQILNDSLRVVIAYCL